jgi:hypothetical protein
MLFLKLFGKLVIKLENNFKKLENNKYKNIINVKITCKISVNNNIKMEIYLK